jgi:hypothetical protein
MKTFIKVFVTFFLSAYAFASFVAWDVCTIVKWEGIGRFAFLSIVLFLSGLISALIEDDKYKGI